MNHRSEIHQTPLSMFRDILTRQGSTRVILSACFSFATKRRVPTSNSDVEQRRRIAASSRCRTCVDTFHTLTLYIAREPMIIRVTAPCILYFEESIFISRTLPLNIYFYLICMSKSIMILMKKLKNTVCLSVLYKTMLISVYLHQFISKVGNQRAICDLHPLLAYSDKM